MAARVAGGALDHAERFPAEQAFERRAVVRRDDLEACLRVLARSGQVAGLQPGVGKAVLGTLGLEPGASDGPVPARGLRGEDRQAGVLRQVERLFEQQGRAGRVVLGEVARRHRADTDAV